jgi:GNAT superfamily N-acetyltransferase
MLDRLIENFRSGANDFARAGEALFGAYCAQQLVGVGGLNIDPYFEHETLGRVRHLFVHPSARGAGIGRALVEAIEARARGCFQRLQLFTPDQLAACFYEALGHEAVDGVTKVSHWKWLDRSSSSLH